MPLIEDRSSIPGLPQNLLCVELQE